MAPLSAKAFWGTPAPGYRRPLATPIGYTPKRLSGPCSCEKNLPVVAGTSCTKLCTTVTCLGFEDHEFLESRRAMSRSGNLVHGWLENSSGRQVHREGHPAEPRHGDPLLLGDDLDGQPFGRQPATDKIG